MTTYVFDNAWYRGRERLGAAEALLDPGTTRTLQGLGVTAGWSCLEVGAGSGSVAAWLCEKVGETGRVVATDIDTRYAEVLRAANLEVWKHDVVRDVLPEAEFDLIHARLVLEHLPDRETVLPRLRNALKPGGWLCVEAVDYAGAVPISAYGAAEHQRTQAVRLEMMTASGLDPYYGRVLPAELRRAGLLEVDAEGRVFVMEGGSPCARWFRLSMEQLRGALVGPGKLDDREVDAMLRLFDDPTWSALSPVIMAAWGRRPTEAPSCT